MSNVEAIEARVAAGETVKPSELATARAADDLAKLTAARTDKINAEQAEVDRLAEIEQTWQAFTVAADELNERIVAAADAVGDSITNLRAAMAEADVMRARFAADMHRLDAGRPSVGQLLEPDVLEGWRKLPTGFNGRSLARWVETRKAER